LQGSKEILRTFQSVTRQRCASLQALRTQLATLALFTMVLQELGSKLAAALQKLQSSSAVDADLLKAVIAEIT
jgi:recombinational DNA repair ATPase RecF